MENSNIAIPICKPIQFNKKSRYFFDNIDNIKSECMFLPIEERFAFVQKVMSRYCLVHDNRVFLYFMNKQSMERMQFIIRSLGYRTDCLVDKICNWDIFTLEILNCDNALFDSVKETKHQSVMYITKVNKLDSCSEMKCLTVESPNHTFICKDFIVTHNTFIMAAIIAKFNVKPVCIFADKIGLCMQLKSEMEKFLGVEVGLVGDGIKDYKDITVISLQSAEEDYIKNAKLCMWDECMPASARIMNQKGQYVTIKEIVDNEKIKYVMSYNVQTKQFEPKKILNRWKKPIENRKMMRIVIENGSKPIYILCTDNHKIWVENLQQYVRSDELVCGQTVVVCNDCKYEVGTIKTVEYVSSHEKYVYDIEVEDNHNFVTENVVVSNCHHIPSATAVAVAKKCTSAYYRIGVSATPWREAGDDMLIEAVLNKKNNTYAINASKLIELGYLVRPKIYFVPILDVFKGKNYNDIYNKAIVDNNHRNGVICKITREMYKRKRKTLILIKNIKHGELLQERLLKQLGEKVTAMVVKHPKTNVDTTVRVKNVEFLSGSDNSLRRRAVLEAVKEGKCDILIASTIADEGLDLPILDTLILAGGGKSSTRAFQRIGRVIRLYKDKKVAYVFDFTDYTPMLRRHSRERQKYYKEEPLWEVIPKFVVNI